MTPSYTGIAMKNLARERQRIKVRMYYHARRWYFFREKLFQVDAELAIEKRRFKKR